MRKSMLLVIGFSILSAACGDDDSTPDNTNNNNNGPSPNCGDGVLDPGEQCDDGAANSDTNPDACRTDCRDAYCGDSIIDSTETCDDYEDNSDTDPDACRTTCVPAHCGDDVQDTGEVCDDGNTVDGDGCSADCLTNESCGNGQVDTGEQCDCGLDAGNLPLGCYNTNDHINAYCIAGCENLCAWNHIFDSANSGDAFATAVDAAGNVAITGKFTGYIDLGGNQLGGNYTTPRAFVAKFDASGNHLWSIWLRNEQFPSGGESEGRGIAFDSQGDLYAMGTFTAYLTLGTTQVESHGDKGTYVVKLNGATGAVTNYGQLGYNPGTIGHFPTGTRVGYGLAVDSNDAVVIVGEFTGSWGCALGPCQSTGLVETNAFVVKLGSSLNVLWSKRMYDDGDDVAAAVAIDSAGDILFSGKFYSTLDLGAGFGLNAGIAGQPAVPQTFAFVAKVSGGGTNIWSKMLGAVNVGGVHAATGLTTLSTGDVVIAGTFLGGLSLDSSHHETSAIEFQAFMVAYAGDGTYLWHRVAGNDWAWSIGVTHDANDNLAFVGAFSTAIDLGGGVHTTQADQGVFVARYDAQGNPLGNRTFGLTDINVGLAVASDPSGRIVFSGYVGGDMDFGCGPYTHASPQAVPFVTMVNPF